MKEFKTAKRVAVEQETVPFHLPNDDFVYEIIATDPPAGVYFDIAAMVEGAPVERLAAIARILDCCLTPDSAFRFAERIRTRDPLLRLDIADAVEVVTWIIGEISGRPTQPSSGSSSGELDSGASSTDDSPNEG